MRILLLVTAFNSLSQAVYTRLNDDGHMLDIVFFINDTQVQSEIDAFAPELILAPFLKSYISESIYENYPTYIFHPGPIGDRGPSSLEYALLSHTKQWGMVILRVNELYDGGDIYASCDFKVRETYKASLYRQEVLESSLLALDDFFEKKEIRNQILNPIHTRFKTKMRQIDWEKDTTKSIIEKVNLSDSFPGVLDEIAGIECYLFGVWQEDKLRGNVKEILAKRDGAICLGTQDGAIWISHLKEPHSFKLPATYVLKEKIRGIKENRLPLLFDKSYKTFYEISTEKRDNVSYLCFNFHNGAMNAEQCIRLKYAFEYLKEISEVIVLVGGMDFFSNGIHLNILEDSKKQGEDGWSNINAMNDLIKSILEADEVVTVASCARNAGAGGVFLALACDYVVAKENIVFNPHYKTLGLSGSEYHTYTFTKRVGTDLAERIVEDALPISVNYAQKIGMIDKVYAKENYYEDLHQYASSLYSDEYIWQKQDDLEENTQAMEACKQNELSTMYDEFWKEESLFHTLRKEFVYKVCPTKTPDRLKGECFA